MTYPGELTEAGTVEITISDAADGARLWVNADGVLIARIYRIGRVVIDDRRTELARMRGVQDLLHALQSIRDFGGIDAGDPSSITLSAAGHLECRRIARAAIAKAIGAAGDET